MLALLCVSSPAPEQRITRIERELAKIERSLARSEVTASETREQIMNASKAQQLMFEAKLVGLQIDFKEQLRSTYGPLVRRVVRLEKVEEQNELNENSGRGCGYIANLTTTSKLTKLGGGRVGSVRLVRTPDGTLAALKQIRPNPAATYGDPDVGFHREVNAQMLGAAQNLGPRVLANCSSTAEILSEMMPAPWINDSRPCESSPNATSPPPPFCAEFEAVLDNMDANGLKQYDFKPEHLRRDGAGVLKMIDFGAVHPEHDVVGEGGLEPSRQPTHAKQMRRAAERT